MDTIRSSGAKGQQGLKIRVLLQAGEYTVIVEGPGNGQTTPIYFKSPSLEATKTEIARILGTQPGGARKPVGQK